jgi:hypothetical protein
MFSGHRRDSKSGGIAIVIILTGVALIVIGYIGVFFGRLIQSAVSRQREFLADASAVQFTRNPDGIAGALKQIGAFAHGSALKDNHATEASHLFFANGLKSSFLDLFATHPPLTERIRAFEPSFDGDFSKIKSRIQDSQPQAKKEKSAGSAALSRDQFITQVGTLAGITLASGASALETISERIRSLAHDPGSARTLVLAFLLEDEAAIRGRQIEAVQSQLGSGISGQAIETVELTRRLDRSQRLTILDLALPALKRLSLEERPAFHAVVDTLIVANDEVSLFEFAVQQLLRRYVPIDHESGRPRVPEYYSIRPLAKDIALLLATMADSGHRGDPLAAEQAYLAGAARIDEVASSAMPEISGLDAEKIAASLDHLSKASLPICKRILDASIQTAGFDGTIEASEAELLRAVSATLDCPIPPMIGNSLEA